MIVFIGAKLTTISGGIMKLKKLLSVIICILMLLSIAVSAGGVDDEDDYPEPEKSGTCGANLQWTIEEGTATLVISGTGDMDAEPSFNKFPTCVTVWNVIIESGVTSIGENAFIYCEDIKSIMIPDSVTKIAKNAFDNCNNIESITVDAANENYLSDEHGVLFDKNKTTLIKYPSKSEITSYTIPDSVKIIERFAFKDSDNFTSIIIPEGVTDIGYQAFNSCSNITSVEIPNSVTKISDEAFNYCSMITDIYYDGNKDQWDDIDIEYGNDYVKKGKIHYSVVDETEGEKTSGITETSENSQDSEKIKEPVVTKNSVDTDNGGEQKENGISKSSLIVIVAAVALVLFGAVSFIVYKRKRA